MLLRAYTIYDVKALQYHSPWFQHTDGMAVRALMDLVNDPNTNIGRHPRDYTLYMCGIYDDSTGLFTPQTPLLFVSDAVSLLQSQPSLPLGDGANGAESSAEHTVREFTQVSADRRRA